MFFLTLRFPNLFLSVKKLNNEQSIPTDISVVLWCCAVVLWRGGRVPRLAEPRPFSVHVRLPLFFTAPSAGRLPLAPRAVASHPHQAKRQRRAQCLSRTVRGSPASAASRVESRVESSRGGATRCRWRCGSSATPCAAAADEDEPGRRGRAAIKSSSAIKSAITRLSLGHLKSTLAAALQRAAVHQGHWPSQTSVTGTPVIYRWKVQAPTTA